MLTKEYTSMLEKLGEKNIFKFNTYLGDGDSEILKILHLWSKDTIIKFFIKGQKEGFLISDDSFKAKKVDKKNNISMCVDWKKILDEKLINEKNPMYKIKRIYPVTFDVTLERSKYLMHLEYYQMHQPAAIIQSLDSMIMTYFSKPERYQKLAGDTKIEDIFANLFSYVFSNPINGSNLYEIITYKALLNEAGIDFESKIDFDTIDSIKIIIKERIEEERNNLPGDEQNE